MTGWRQASVYSPVFKHVWSVVLCCIQASVSTLEIKHAKNVNLVAHAKVSSSVFRTLLDYGSVSVCKHQSYNPFDQNMFDCGTLLYTSIASNTCGLWIIFAYSYQFPTLCFKHVWTTVLCLCTRNCLRTFDRTRLGYGSLLCTSISLHLCFKHILWFLVRVHHQSYSPLSQTRLILASYLCTLPPTPK